ncbi:MAG TPA: FtsX-like permease family protein [Lachnospiraceae bacterium]|nr:FtsX-like permease family protein [Lachnospiraceae bacterium]
MIKLMLQKLLHKKWMVLCLLIGNTLLIAIAASHPMYRDASFQKMLTNEFVNFEDTTQTWPAHFSMSLVIQKDRGSSLETGHNLISNVAAKLGVDTYETFDHYSLGMNHALSNMVRDDTEEKSVKIGSITNLPNHIDISAGELYQDQITNDGYIEAIISEACMVKMNLLVGEVMEFTRLTDPDGNPIVVKIVGVFKQHNANDYYFQETPDSLDNEFIISEIIFSDLFLGDYASIYNTRCSWNVLFDYKSFTPSQVNHVIEQTDNLLHDKTWGKTLTASNYVEILTTYLEKENRIDATLFILQIPVFVLLCAFLFMISGQMLSMEQNEISLMKSRGASKFQIIRLYFWQSLFLSGISFCIGLPLSMLICNILGSSNAFLEFVQRSPLKTAITADVLLYSFAAVAVSTIITVIPVIKYSDVSIVNLKQRRSRSEKPLWQRLFIDLLLIIVSLYGYYSFSKKLSFLSENIMSGNSLDPLLYFSSSLFILGFGLLFLRIQPFIVKLIYLPGKSHWKPASYASFLQTFRTGKKQQFTMLFMVLTVALGIFHATVARTIIANGEANINYINSTDLMVKEVWYDNKSLVAIDPSVSFTYIEPDFRKYNELPQVTMATKVIINNDCHLQASGKTKPLITVMGIHSKEFGETTTLSNDLLNSPYYDYLNALASDSNAIIVSTNFKNTYDYRLGDKLTFTNVDNKVVTGTIYGFVDYWPSYIPLESVLLADGTYTTKENYIVICNIATLQNSWGVYPYEVWMNVNGSTDFFYDWIEEKGMNIKSYSDRTSNLIEIRNDTLFQGTNGILTMSFIIILILCGVGYLIYWIMSIRSRELLFGILRAMGMRKSEIIHMLINEQIFSGLFSIFAGTIIGFVSSRLFVPIIQTAYATSNQILPLILRTDSSDMKRLFSIIGAVLLFCLVVIEQIIQRMKITNALKLGED